MNPHFRFALLALAVLSPGATSPLAGAPDKSSDHGPKVISVVQPVRPRPMFEFGKTGRIEVTFTITAVGDVTEVRICRSNDVLLEKPVIDAISQWKFSPAVKGGRAVAVHARQSFIFDSKDTEASRPRDLPATPLAPNVMIARK